MKNLILEHISRLEDSLNLQVVLACETGSRAWGFPSPDSDYDVRLIYLHSTEWYHTLFEKKDSVEYMSEDGEIDLTGWELRKTLRLLSKSNPALLERLQSPIVYKSEPALLGKIQELVPHFYSRRASLHHYASMAKKSVAGMADSTYRLKTFFYALRAASACRWIHLNEVCPPIVFSEMLEGIDMPQALRNRTQELVELKAGKSEAYMHEGELSLRTWIDNTLNQSWEDADRLPATKGDLGLLDDLLNDSLK